jgi:hypothetical protein
VWFVYLVDAERAIFQGRPASSAVVVGAVIGCCSPR